MNPKLTRLAPERLARLVEQQAADTDTPLTHEALTHVEAALVYALRAIRLTSNAGSLEWNLARDSFYTLTSGRKPPRPLHIVALGEVARKWILQPTATKPNTRARRLELELHGALLTFMLGEGLMQFDEAAALEPTTVTTLVEGESKLRPKPTKRPRPSAPCSNELGGATLRPRARGPQ